MLQKIKSFLTYLSAVKFITYVISFIISIPVLSVIYWIFDSSYLGAFGIGPELYSRPVFSSHLLNVWFFVTTLRPFLWILIGVCVLIFLVLTISNYNADKIVAASVTDQDKTESKFPKIIKAFNAIEKSIMPAAFILYAGIFGALITALIAGYWSKEGGSIAVKQIENFRKNGTCKDAFNDRLLGCYTIKGEDEDNVLLILNTRDTIAYMTRKIQDGSGCPTLAVVVKNKLTQEKIIRQYVKAESNE